MFPQSCGSSIIKSHWLSKSNFLGILSLFARLPDWETCCGPYNFKAVWELLWYKCSPVCGLSAWWLYGGANGDLPQEDFCLTPCLQGLLQPEPLSSWQATADLGLCRRHANTQRQIWLSLLWGSLLPSLGPGAQKVLFTPSKCLWQVWGLILNVILSLLPSCWDFSFALGHGVSFFGELQLSPVDGCSAAICNFGVLAGEDECTSFYSAISVQD